MSVYVTEKNNLNLTRSLAATAVVFGHSFILASGSKQWLWFNSTNSEAFGFLAVSVFFGLSGFLITQSFFNRPNWAAFMKARLLRLVPGLAFANLVTASAILLLFLPLNAESLKQAAVYIGRSTIFKIEDLAGVFATNPEKGVNGSLWTLGYEFQFYVYTLLAGLSGLLTRRRIFALVVLLITICCSFKFPGVTGALEGIQNAFKLPLVNKAPAYLALTLSFTIGILAYLFRERFRLSIGFALALLFAALFTTNWVFLVVAWIYGAYVFSLHPSLYISWADRWWDCSYGIYILSYPTQQTLLKLGFVRDGYALFLATMAIVLPLAAFSWKIIEEPALRLKGRLSFTSKQKRVGTT